MPMMHIQIKLYRYQIAKYYNARQSYLAMLKLRHMCKGMQSCYHGSLVIIIIIIGALMFQVIWVCHFLYGLVYKSVLPY